MGYIFKQSVTRRTKDGTKYTAKSRNFHARFDHPLKGRRQVALKTSDRSAALSLLRDLEIKAAREATGHADPFDAHLERPLPDHRNDWSESLRGKGDTEQQVVQVAYRVKAVCDGCGFTLWRHIESARVHVFIGKLRNSGLKSRTRNHYLQAIRSFTRWMYEDRRVPHDPLIGLKPEPVADEQEAGVFTPDELRTLLETTEAGPVRRSMSGFARRVLYELASYTGFRNSECRTLVWGDVDLDANPPTATVTAKRAKNRKRYDQPLTSSLAAILGRWRVQCGMVDRMDPVFPQTPHKTRMAAMLREDMQAAKLDECDAAGRARNFHSLRHTLNTMLETSGVSLTMAMDLMRHSDPKLTAKRYAHRFLPARAAAIDALPDASARKQSVEKIG